MKEKGFTLIELLAVIVILAIIALIATPIILGIINDARKESQERSAELYLNGVELAIARKNLSTEFSPTECTITGVNKLDCDSGELTVEVDGEVPTSGTIKFDNNKVKEGTLKFNGFTATIQEGKITVGSESEEETPSTPASNVCEATQGDGSNVGDIITCTLTNGDEDKFYVVNNDGTNIEMLTELNIDLTTYQQSSNAEYIAFTSDSMPNYYWRLNDIYTPAGDSSLDYVYDRNSNTFSIIENYVSYLNTNGLNGVTGKLMSYEQFKKIGIKVEDDYLGHYSEPNWLFTEKGFWLGTVGDGDGYIVFYITPYDQYYCLAGENCSPDEPELASAGVRPVITISTSDIQ